MKKTLAFILMLGILSMLFIPASAAESTLDGDVDASGAIDTKDIRLYLSGLVADESAQILKDLNGDGAVDTLDVRVLLDALTAADTQDDRLLVFETPENTSLTHDELLSNCVAQVVGTYDEFEAVYEKIRYAFYTPYENEYGSFDAWAQTITPAYFDEHSLFICTYGMPYREFAVDYVVADDTVDITIKRSGMNAFCHPQSRQLIVEIDKEDLAGRTMTLHWA